MIDLRKFVVELVEYRFKIDLGGEGCVDWFSV